MHENSLHGLTIVGAALPEGCTERVGDWLLFDGGTQNADFNQAVVTELASGAAATLAVAENWFAARDTPFTFWLRSPDDDAVIEEAVRAGYRELSGEPAMLLESLDNAWRQPDGFDVRAVVDHEGVLAYAAAEQEEADRYARHHELDIELARALLDSPGVRFLVGYRDGTPIARSMVEVSGAMAGVTNVYVAPSARGRGFGTAITAAAIIAGRDLGATSARLEASTMGRPVYERMGFREVYRYVRFGR